MKNEIIENDVETQVFEDLLPGRFKNYDAGNRQIYKQAMVTVVLINLMYEFDGVSGSEFFGLPLLNDSCEEVVAKWKNVKPTSPGANSLKDDSKRKENIQVEVLILLSMVFAQMFYLLRANGHSYRRGQSAVMDLFFRELLHLDENDEIRSKLIALNSLIVGDPKLALEQLKRGYFDYVNAFATIMHTPHFAETTRNLMRKFLLGEELTRAEVLDLCKSNFNWMKA